MPQLKLEVVLLLCARENPESPSSSSVQQIFIADPLHLVRFGHGDRLQHHLIHHGENRMPEPPIPSPGTG